MIISCVKKEKYDKNFISFGIIDEYSYPQCVVCKKVLPNDSMVPSNGVAIFKTNHKDVKNKPFDYFIQRCVQFLKNKNFITEISKKADKMATEASYMVSHRLF